MPSKKKDEPTVDYTKIEVYDVFGMNEKEYAEKVTDVLTELHSTLRQISEDNTTVGKVLDIFNNADDICKFTIMAVLVRNLEEFYGQQAMIRGIVLNAIQPYLNQQMGSLHIELEQIKNGLVNFMKGSSATDPKKIIQFPGQVQ